MVDEGKNCKYLFKDKYLGDIWLFKVYESSLVVNKVIATYRLAQLLGIDISGFIRTSLPINGLKRYGLIQKMIPKVKNIGKVTFKELIPEQIECVMKNQVLDWLVFGADLDEEEFLIKEETGKIIVIDKDETFSMEDGINLLADNLGGDSYYYRFWEAYINGELNVDDEIFKRVFEMIDYFQSINDKYIIYIMDNLLKGSIEYSEFKSMLKAIILRKHNLRKDFENFYKTLTERKRIFFKSPPIDKSDTYARLVLNKLKERIAAKKYEIEQLKLKKYDKQENVRIVSCPDAWYLIRELNYVSREKFIFLADYTVRELIRLKEEVTSIYEKFTIELYLEQIKNIQSKDVIENFVQREIKMIYLLTKQITDDKISQIEYNLRIIYGEQRTNFSEYRKRVDEKQHDILSHLEYFQYPIGGDCEKEEELILKYYRGLLKKNPSDVTYKLLYGILTKDKEYIEKIKDDFAWKYLGLGLIYGFNQDRDLVNTNCGKALLYNGGKEVDYYSYMLMGIIYEYNKDWERFGEEFEIEKSIVAYKKALKINPNSVKVHLNLGILYLAMEETDKALDEFKEVNRLDPQYGREHFSFNMINDKNKYKDKKEYLEAVKMNTLSGSHHYIIGLTYLIKEDEKMAKKHFDKAKELGYVFLEVEKNEYKIKD